MFRSFSTIRSLLGAVIPLMLMWNWAACPVLCSEIVERQQQEIAVSEKSDGNIFSSFDAESCPVTANPVITEARQSNVFSALPVLRTIKSGAHEFRFVPAVIYAADVRQNSPPSLTASPPLYLTHQAFRI